MKRTATARGIDWLFRATIRLLAGASARWDHELPGTGPFLFAANHTSHLDFLVLWAALPAAVRARVRPVAAADYWNAGWLRRYLSCQVFRAVLVERNTRSQSALDPARQALADGDSLLYFPEGTRGPGPELGPLRPGVYHLAAASPRAAVVPVWIDNTYRVMPKGARIPVPLPCTVRFAAPIRPADEEERDPFLARLTAAMRNLRTA